GIWHPGVRLLWLAGSRNRLLSLPDNRRARGKTHRIRPSFWLALTAGRNGVRDQPVWRYESGFAPPCFQAGLLVIVYGRRPARRRHSHASRFYPHRSDESLVV